MKRMIRGGEEIEVEVKYLAYQSLERSSAACIALPSERSSSCTSLTLSIQLEYLCYDHEFFPIKTNQI